MKEKKEEKRKVSYRKESGRFNLGIYERTESYGVQKRYKKRERL